MTNSIEIYQADDGKLELNVTLENETVWLTQLQMVELFGRDQSVLSRHIRNVFKDGELSEKSNMQKNAYCWLRQAGSLLLPRCDHFRRLSG